MLGTITLIPLLVLAVLVLVVIVVVLVFVLRKENTQAEVTLRGLMDLRVWSGQEPQPPPGE